jgi:hypothetical protein
MDSTVDYNALVFQLRPDIVIETFEDGALLLRLSDRHLIEVNPVGQRILNLTDGQRSALQVAAHLAQHFDISTEEALQDTLSFYADLQKQGVLELAPQAAEKETDTMPEHSTLAAHYLRNPDVVLREEDEDGGLLFNPDTNQVKVVNPTGMFIWQKCDGQNGLDEIAQALEQAFEDAPPGEVSQDVQEFLDGMLQSGFIGTVE